MLEFSNCFLQVPIIFVAHSLGGIVVKDVCFLLQKD